MVRGAEKYEIWPSSWDSEQYCCKTMYICVVLQYMKSTRMPVTTASRKGVSKLASEAEKWRVVLTSHGRPIAVVDSAERLDEDLRRVREASRSVVETAGEPALGRSNKFTLEDVCAKLNIDPSRVRERVAAKRG